jgi:hypothetical protein
MLTMKRNVSSRLQDDGEILVIATWTYRKSMGYPLNYYDNTKVC